MRAQVDSLTSCIVTNAVGNSGLRKDYLNLRISSVPVEVTLTKKYLSFANIVGMKSTIQGIK